MTMMILAVAAVSSVAAVTRRSIIQGGAATRSRHTADVVLMRLRGGVDVVVVEDTSSDVDEAFAVAFSRSMKVVEAGLKGVSLDLDAGKPFLNLGAKLDAVLASSVESFVGAAPGRASAETLAERQSVFEGVVKAELELVFVRQLGCLRASLLARPVSAEPDAVAQLEAEFAQAAAESEMTDAQWDFAGEQASLAAVATELASRSSRAVAIGVKAAAQQQSYMELFQMYQAQIAQLNQAVKGTPPSFSASYRLPDTNIALSATKSADRTTVSVNCVPDETSPALLGAQGFVKGFSPANLGVNLNIHI